jgi:hypothetical protein
MSEIQAEDTIVDDEFIDEVAEEEVPAEQVEEEAIDEDVITIGDESPSPEEVEQAQAPAWVKELRKSHREVQRENRELKEKLKVQTQPETKVELGQKPKLEDCDYDAEKYEGELSSWYERKREVEAQNAKIREAQAAEEKAWQEKLNAYSEAKTKLRVNDYEDAELAAQELLSKTQQGIILDGAENPAAVVYALGKNPAKAKELAAIKNPVKYAFAVAKLETQLKITKRTPPTPEGTVSRRGSAPISGSVDSTLDRLREEASRTGDFNKVIQYKRQRANK